MKTTIFKEVLDETVIEVKGPIKEVIKKLRAQRGSSRERDSDRNELGFFCTKKGKIMVLNSNNGRPNARTFYITGKVCEQDGKTVVKFYSVKNRETAFVIIMYALLVILVGAYFVAKTVSEYEIVPSDLLLIVPIVVLALTLFVPIKKAHKHKEADLEIMKQIVINRIEAIKRWDD